MVRNKSIDLLRAFAILGVLFRHSIINSWYARAGWAGVDLFFVLSGFLVSGLLFNEFRKSGDVNIKRFLIRRGFKIYPAFYVFLLVALITEKYWFNANYPFQNILSEVFFMQSYFNGCFLHTWSLAIEEHFYILLSVFVLFAVNRKWILNKWLMVAVLSGSVLIVFLLRLQYVNSHFQDSAMHFFQTHLRMDGLLIGVLISFLYHFTGRFFVFVTKHRIILSILAICFISLPFILNAGSFFMLTLGLTLMQTGFGILVTLVVAYSDRLDSSRFSAFFVFKGLSFVGRFSYSIYLWHLFLYKILLEYWQKEPPVILYFVVTIAGGICLSLLVEQLFLKIRDKYFSPLVVRIN
jgi:peptidoglycan/LPS O-acetylase OafA/YrhL